MAQITINIPNDKVQLVVDALRDELGDVEGATDAQLVKHHIREFLKRTVMRSKRRAAQSQHVESIVPDDTLVS